MNDCKSLLDRNQSWVKYVLLLSLITFVSLFAATVAHGAWYDLNWQYRKQITIKGSEVTGGPHASFPVLIQLALDADLAGDAQDDGDDILFTSSDETTKIPHEIESFNGSTGALVAWVKVDLNANPANTIIYMYYGYASTTNQQDATNVWNSNYKGVWHLEEDPSGTSPQMTDSTTNLNHGTSQGFMTSGDQVAGKIGGSLEFDGGNDYVYTTDSFNNPQNFTVSAWFKTGSASGKRVVGFESDRTGTASGSWDRHIYVGTDGKVYFGAYDGTTDVAISTNTLNDNIWHHAVGVRDDAANYIRLYIDGNLNDSTSNNFAQNYIGWWRIGSYKSGSWTSGANGYFPGFIDEVRISNTDHSAQWIQTEYNNQNNPSNFITVGSATPSGGSNNPPNVNAGPDDAVTLPNQYNLDGYADSGADGPTTPPNSEWTKQSGPGTVTFGDPYAQDTTASFSTNGTYVLRLTADDGADTAYDEVTITVYPVGGAPPVDDYTCNMKITIDNTKVAGSTDLANFPVLISLTEESLKNTGTGCGLVLNSDGSDIIFTDSARTLQLDHEIEKYDGTAGELVAWVRVPSLAATTDTVIYLYYGNSNITSPQENPTGVWDSNYVGVWHLQDQNNIEDSTSYGNDGTPNNVDNDAGVIEGGQDFDGNDDIDLGRPANGSLNFKENTDFCISAWFKADINTRNMTIVGQQRQTSIVFGIYDPSGDKIYFRMDDSPYHESDSGISTGQWYHAAICYDYISGTTGYSYMYVNGVAQTTNGLNTYNTVDTADSWNIGDEDRWCPTCGSVGNDEVFDGDMDEVRMSKTVRPAAWFTTSYNNQNNPSSFYTVEKQCPDSTPPIAEFACSIPITIDSSKVSGTSDLVDFPVLISLTNTSLKSTANCGYVQHSNGYDIIFSDAAQTTRLDHEIEKYDSASGQLVAWVRIPTLSVENDTTIYVHFGHSSVCGPTENPAGVWDSNYTTVWHLKETSGGAGAIKDSTASANHGTDFNGPTFGVTGKIGNAIDFDGANDYATMPTLGFSTSAGAVELWANIDTFPSSDSKYMFSHFTPSPTANRVYVNLKPDNTWGTGMGNTYDLVRGSTLIANTWYHIVLTWDGTYVRGYKDGALNFGPTSYSGLTTVGNIYVSAWDVAGEWFDGTLDEVRISNVGRSADWINTSYNNQSDPANFYSVGQSSCFLGGFSCNRKITIPGDNVSGSSNLTNFPLLLKIENDCNLKNSANGGHIQDSNGYDIIFTDSSGASQLDHEIEEYDGVRGDLTAWVKIPTLYGSSDTDIYMYYGKSSLPCDPSNPAGVWSNGYRGVWHLHDTSGDTQDSTSYNTDGTLYRAVTRGATGEIDNAFDVGYQGEVNWGNPGDGHLDAGTGSWTVSLWVNIDRNRGLGEWEKIINKGKDSGETGYEMELDDTANNLYFAINDGTTTWGRSAVLSFSLDTWMYLAGVIDRNSGLLRLYKDGDQEHTTDISGYGNIDVSDDLRIGKNDWGYPYARFEEVRISNTARSAGWIKTEYNNQNDPSSFCSISQDTCGGAYGLNYQYCKKITVDHTQVNSTLTNFPLLLNIAGDDDLKTVANGGRVEHNLGYDIIFRSPTCGQLDHEIEKYDGSAGTLIAWVRVPTLSAGTDTEVYMYYGDSGVICSPENPPGVWDSNYVGVWHLDETVDDEATTGTHYDSTANDNDGSQTNNDDTEGKIGTAQMFDGNSDYIYTSNSFNNPQNFTVSAWFKTSTASGKRVVGFESDQSGTNSGSWDRHIYVGTDGKVYFGAYDGTTDVAVSTNTLNDDTWHYAVGVRDNGADYIRLYIDGSLNNSTYNSNAQIYSGWWRIGSYKSSGWTSGQDGFFPGGIDEVRVSNTVRLADWIMTEYKNQNDPGNFYTIGSCFEQSTKMTEGWVEEVQ